MLSYGKAMNVAIVMVQIVVVYGFTGSDVRCEFQSYITINIFSQIALVILIGISTKNSILIVDYANQLRALGKNIENSITEACSLRFRPIMMTSLSTMIAMIPLIVGNIGPGAGEGSRLAVGATILGGMIISTFFTLYVTPTMYLALAKNTKRIDTVDIELKKQLR